MKIILGTPINARPYPWLYYRVPAIMINAFDLLRKGVRKVNLVKPILQFEGEVWMDSGGFQFLKKGLTPNLEELMRLYESIWDVRFFLSLDYPPSPQDDVESLERKFQASLKNYDLLYRRLDSVIPVIHFHWRVDVVVKYLKTYIEEYTPSIIAVGGLVPYILIQRGVPKGSRELALKFLLALRNYVKCRIHVLGLGSPLLNPILKAIGIDSTDSNTWRVKAAYGKVVLPGGGERHVSEKEVSFGRKKASEDDLRLLREFLRRTGFPLLDRFDEIRTSFDYRALVNAWVVLHSYEEPKSPTFNRLYRMVLECASDGRVTLESLYVRR